MSCYRPVFGYIDIRPGIGKRFHLLRFQGERTELERERMEADSKFLEVPCGKCLGCRLDKSKEWATRIMLESKYYLSDECHFITFTYDDDHIPTLKNGLHTLVTAAEFGKELKRLRSLLDRSSGDKIRFYGCGEYGDKFERPHYHFIIFGLKLPDKQLFKISKSGSPIYVSEFLNNFWNKGFVTVQDLTYESAAYTARYVMKKQTKKFHEAYGRVPEWVNMSRKPGIGRQYFEDYKDQIYKFDGIPVKQRHGAYMQKPSRYFDKLYDVSDHEKCEAIKSVRRKKGSDSSILKMTRTSLSLDRQRAVDEEAKAAQILSLKRNFDEGIDN